MVCGRQLRGSGPGHVGRIQWTPTPLICSIRACLMLERRRWHHQGGRLDCGSAGHTATGGGLAACRAPCRERDVRRRSGRVADTCMSRDIANNLMACHAADGANRLG
jgi:hypothetical protein